MKEYDPREDARRTLILAIARLGYPQEFGAVIADSLGSEQTMRRMLAYLRQAKPRTAEEIADEMLAIRSDVDRWVSKKRAEYYNIRYNEMLYYGLTDEEE